MVFPPQGSGSGSGGGDAYFVGWYNTSTELSTSFPTAEDGNYAKVVDTATIWVWDTDTYIWTDSGINAYTDGDMLKSVYDTDDDGIVDNSERLGNQLPAYYLAASAVPVAGAGLSDSSHTFNVNVDGTTIEIDGSDQLHVIGGGGSGDVTGPSSSVSGDIATFSGTTGKIIQDSGLLLSDVPVKAASSTAGHFVSFSNTDGKTLADSGYSAANIITTFDGLSDTNFISLADDDVPRYDITTGKWLNTQLDYGDVYAPALGSDDTAIAKFSGTSGQNIVSTDIFINSSNNLNLNQHTLFNGVIDGGSLD